MDRIVADHSNSISLHDRYGNILLNFQGIKVGNLVGMNVDDLVHEYSWSPSQKAVLTRAPVVGVVSTKHSGKQLVCANPILDGHGEVSMVVVTAMDKTLVDRYEALIERGAPTDESYRLTVQYLSESDCADRAIVAESPQMRRVMATAESVAKSDSTILLTGASGTGKEVVARFIHGHSRRAKGGFIPVNCAAIPQELMESEFFGYVQGAFTGANPRGKEGLFELADRGTLFLDEIGDLPLNMQSKLLRVLETGEVTRLGDIAPRRVDVRLIAATNRDLKEMIRQKLFRSDLYFRLNVIPIPLPGLRERPDDILPLAYSILQELNEKYGLDKRFTPQAKEAFFHYDWPGNVRELRNVIERLVVTSENADIYIEDGYFRESDVPPDADELADPPRARPCKLRDALARAEADCLRAAMDACGGRVAEAAALLGIHRSVLYRKLRALHGARPLVADEQ
ncbi:MAG: sigma 54-interacting transcriptional regulator [Clostridiales Family XIII bacterium]|jgi:transcriptional regulator with PAS, ATPase and Fis domain|nr:sigma 54-interacting transcriptional regulator [Clostridiales Family XIII bacterium]